MFELADRWVLEGGIIVTSRGREPGEILIEGEKIAAVGRPGAFRSLNVERLDARGKYVLPGAIDAHVHSRDPGATYKEDITTLTEGAVKGGVTTVLEMPNTVPPVHDAATFRAKAESYVGRAYADYGLWGMILGDRNLAELEGLAWEGVVGYKLFWGYWLDENTYALVYDPEEGRRVLPPPDEGEVLEAFAEVSRLGLPFAIHAEAPGIVRRRSAAVRGGSASGLDSYGRLLFSRPPVAEAHLIRVAASLAREVGGHLHVVHLSSAAGLEAVREERRLGTRLTAETCPHYLTLTAEDYGGVGGVLKCYPPVREREHQEALWKGLLGGEIDIVGSDHAPHSRDEKMGRKLEDVPAGFPGVELLLPIMLHHVACGRVSLEKVVELTAENPARLFGIGERKGFIEPGRDADLCIVDLNERWRVDARELASKSKVSPYEGMEIQGRVWVTVLRGRVVMMEGQVKGAPGGRLVRRGVGGC